QETLASLRVVKAFGQEDQEQARFVNSSGQSMRARISLALVENIFELITGMIFAVGTAAVLYLGIRHVQTGILSLGELVLVMTYLSRLYWTFLVFTQSVNLLQTLNERAERPFCLVY